MSTVVQETEKLISHMTRAEKAQVLQWIVQDLGDIFPGIESQMVIYYKLTLRYEQKI